MSTSQFTPEQWARAGEEACRFYATQSGLTPTDAELQEARETAVWIATGRKQQQPDPDPT